MTKPQSPLESVSALLDHLLAFPAQSEFAPGSLDSFTVTALIYGRTLLRRRKLRAGREPLPPQLVVVGPTQSGKSTVVNLVLGDQAAKASPLAGFTRHPQAFAVDGELETLAPILEELLPDWQLVPAGELVEGQPDTYALSGTNPAFPDSAILWDTPDFDSVNSREYRDMVPVICGLADILLLVVSREKYADQSVWRMLNLIAPVKQPLVICINKTSGKESEQLLSSMTQRLVQASVGCTALLTLPYKSGPEELLWNAEEAVALRNQLSGLVAASSEKVADETLATLLDHYWEQWVEPVRCEHAAADRWQSLIDEDLLQLTDQYRRDYLHNPDYSDSLQRAIAKLLELLEIPGIAGALVQTRKVLTWPARKLHALYKQKYSREKPSDQGHEVKVIEEAVAHLMVRVRQQIGEQIANDRTETAVWWKNLEGQFKRDHQEIRSSLSREMEVYQSEFEEEIKGAGEKLFEHLQDHPVALNGLRATRATADAAALVLAIKTGGIGLNDLILTPAMLSVTSFLAEGAVGRYMGQVEEELKNRQLEMVTTHLIEGVLGQKLAELPLLMPQDGCYAISRQLLENAEAQLAALK
ncbi:MAG: GTPase domain-containing protein [Gammaproteobacteria bacterium]|nr:GTPase domain-containing protein [Gammaproteobacteria bacterium]